jgi:hypothetical protein
MNRPATPSRPDRLARRASGPVSWNRNFIVASLAVRPVAPASGDCHICSPHEAYAGAQGLPGYPTTPLAQINPSKPLPLTE